MVGEASSEDEEENIADEGAERGRKNRVPQDEDLLVGEETAKNGGTFALRDSADKDREQPVLFDEMMDRVGHEADCCEDSLSSIRLIISVSCTISSRIPRIWPWRSSSSFSCSAMISISAFRLTS